MDILQIYIEREPQNFTQVISNPLDYTNKKWFINLINTVIPINVSNLLQLGGNFCLPIDRNRKATDL